MNISFPVQGTNQADMRAEAERIARLFFTDIKDLQIAVTDIHPVDPTDGGVPKPGSPVTWMGTGSASDDGRERFGQVRVDTVDSFDAKVIP